ncbi:acyltransferase [Bordetella sp. 02P26C-1]|uniref:acyltransferase n=1 Tax=Bordetella sp. 02P26C-1 TaxID=2683195 RepID=UPI001355A49D|nr:acyltransferase family protein [Bordetella sp. 02P26C-1]MVW80462.1 acyltransferase family protein [Bordetella sp. 02P26C-1]
MHRTGNDALLPAAPTSTTLSVNDKLARLDAARWIAALAVVLLHCAAQAVSDPDAYASGDWVAANLYDSAARWCVPVFVMVSGALMLDNRKPLDPQTFYLRRAARICAPLVFWTLFYLAWRSLLGWLDDGQIDISFWPTKIAQGEPYYHLWYLYMIMGLYLITPLVRTLYHRGTKNARAWYLAGLFGIAVLDALYRQMMDTGHGFFLTWFVPYLGYFIAGRMMFDGELRVPSPGWVLAGAVTATAAGVYWLSDHVGLNFYFYDYFSLTVLAMSLAAFQCIMTMTRLPALSMLAPLTFGIYLIHPVFLDIAQRTSAQTSMHAAWSLPVQAFSVFTLSAAACWLLRQHPTTRKLV